MDSAKAAQYIQQPALLRYADKAELEQWVAAYPYVPVFRVLLACKVMENSSDPLAAVVLEKAAFYVNNRRSLKKLVHEWQSANIEEEIPHHEKPESSPDEALTYSEATLEQTSEVAIAIDISGEEPLKVPEVIVEETLALASDLPETNDATSSQEWNTANAPLISEENSEENNKDLEEILAKKDISSSAIEEEALSLNSSEENEIIPSDEENLEITSEEISEIESVEDSISEPIETVDSDLNIHEAVFDDEMSDEDFLKAIGKWTPEIAPSIEQVSTEGETPGEGAFEISADAMLDTGIAHADIAWLLPWLDDFAMPELISTEKKIQLPLPEKNVPVSAQAISTIQQTIEEKIDEPLVAAPEIKTTETTSPNQEFNTTTEKSALNTAHSFEDWLNIVEQKPIDPQQPVFEAPARDIVEELKNISPPQEVKKPVIPPMPEQPVTLQEKEVQRIASESVAFEWGNATETLAKIFIRQGKPDKAIEIYQQLIMKYPEKSTYFASLIKNIKGN